MSSHSTIDHAAKRRPSRQRDPKVSILAPNPEINGALDFAGIVSPGLFLACGWLISATAEPPIIELQTNDQRKTTSAPLAIHWQDRPALADYLESGHRAVLKRGFIAVFADDGSDEGGHSITIAALHDQPAPQVFNVPDETFADYFASAQATQQFEVVLLLGSAASRLGFEERGAYRLAVQPWLDGIPICESGGTIGGVTLGFDRVAIGKEGQIFVEGWMKASGQSRPPTLRLAVAHGSSFICQTIDQAVLRPDIAPPGAGGLQRPGFFIVGQSQIDVADGAPPVVVELINGTVHYYLRLLPQQLQADEWRSTLVNRVADKITVSSEARRALLTFFETPALAKGSWVAAARSGRRISALCVVDVTRHDPCRSLIQASLAHMPASDIAILLVGDEDINRTKPDIAPLWASDPGRTVFAHDLAEAIREAGLKPDDTVLFIASATLIRNGMFEAIEAAIAADDAALWLCMPQDVAPEHQTALEALLCETSFSVASNPRQRKSIAYVDFFVPLVAPAGEILVLAEAWTPPLPGLTYREAVRRAAGKGMAQLATVSGMSTYRQHSSVATSVATLYKDIL